MNVSMLPASIFVCPQERRSHLVRITFCAGRIGNVPMSLRGLAGNDRASFASSIVANRNHVIEGKPAVMGKFIPRLGAHLGRVMSQRLEKPDRSRVNLALGLTARTVSAKASIPYFVQDRFGHD